MVVSASGADRNESDRTMKYFIMLAGDAGLGPFEELSPEQQGALFEQFGGFDAGCAEAEGVEILSGEALQEGSVATTMRYPNGELTITDGPYAEATEQIGGFYLVEAPDLDTMTNLCKILPDYDIEIRPVADMG